MSPSSDGYAHRSTAEHGTYNTGSGPQNVYQHFHAAQSAAPDRESRSTALAPAFLAALRRRFDHPAGMANARRILARTHTVLIDGEPGSGRNAVARMMLYEYAELRGNLHEVLPEDDEGNVQLAHRPTADAEGLLLDLSETDDKAWTAIQRSLPGFQEAVRRSGSRLTVVLPAPVPGGLHADLLALRATVHRPDSRLVLLSGLREAEVPSDQDLSVDVCRFLDSGPPLHQVAHLAWLIRAALDKNPAGKFDEWCRTAMDALTGWTEKVDKALARERGRSRALLLTTAMLHGAHSDALYEATESLLSTVRHPVDERPVLEREDLAARFKQIGAKADEYGRVTFADMDYDAAIRARFWTNMPGLRTQLGTWARNVVTLDVLTPDDRVRVAEHLAEHSLRTGGVQNLLSHIRSWTGRDDSRARPAAVQALTRGALHPDHGATFRKELYEWATSSDLPDGQAEALIHVCSGQFAARFPERAMVRLHQLARRHRLGRQAEHQLIELTQGDFRLHRQMLERLARDLPRRWPADLRLFAALSSPRCLTTWRTGPRTLPHAALDDSNVRRLLTTCWQTLFTHAAQADWLELCDRWLLTAQFVAPGHRERLIEILVSACAKDAGALGRLYHLASRYPVEPLVLRKINHEQGIRATDS